MFDPSKLNLDLNSEEEIQKPETNDVLGNLDETKTIISEKEEEIKKETIKKEEIKIDEKQIGKTDYERKIEKEIIEKKENNIIFDINLNSLQAVLVILVDKKYDFVTFEPDDKSVKVIFRKNKVIIDTKFIKYPTYTNILIKAKALAKLTIEETENTQEGKGETTLKNKSFKVDVKVVPGNFGSKMFIKTTEIQKKLIKKEVEKISISQILTYLGALALITLIIGGSFIGFIVMNAKTVEDVKFFASLGINLNDINEFIKKTITIIFSVLVFIQTSFLVTFLFKFSLTKKEFKQKKIRYGIISTIILIFTLITASAWMVIYKKVSNLPNWQEMAYGDIQIYDNSKLTSESFNKVGSILKDTSNLIGPVEIKFDLTFFAKKEEQKSGKIIKYIWDFGDGKTEIASKPTIIHKFKEKGNYDVSLEIEIKDIQGKIITKKVENIPSINLSYNVKINEKILDNGGKLVNLDAHNIKELGKIEWYFLEDLDNPVWKGEKFILPKPIFDETIVGMYIRRNDKISEELDKIFVISGENKNKLNGEIDFSREIIEDLKYEFKVKNLVNDYGDGYVEKFIWTIGTKKYTKKGDINDPTKSSTIKHKFKKYGEHKIELELINSAGETKKISKIINVNQNVRLSRGLIISEDGDILDNIKYNKKLNEYFIDEIGIPTKIKLEARYIKEESNLYSLKKVDWDYNSDGDIDESSKTGHYDVSVEGNHTITVTYYFEHKKDKTKNINLTEKIYIEGFKKEAILKFKIKKDSNYAPITVGFDASKSEVKEDDIIKFIWNYGDGIKEERDAVVPGHRYSASGDYIIELEVITESGKHYSISKTLSLKPKQQTIEITNSLNKAHRLQGIDFSSAKSEGQIVSWFWNFGDGETSTEANPTHAYRKEGKYNVELILNFSNKNELKKKKEIIIEK